PPTAASRGEPPAAACEDGASRPGRGRHRCADRVPALLCLPALPPPGLRSDPGDDSARIRAGAALGLPRPSVSPPRPGEPPARDRVRAAAPAARAVSAPFLAPAARTRSPGGRRAAAQLRLPVFAVRT